MSVGSSSVSIPLEPGRLATRPGADCASATEMRPATAHVSAGPVKYQPRRGREVVGTAVASHFFGGWWGESARPLAARRRAVRDLTARDVSYFSDPDAL